MVDLVVQVSNIDKTIKNKSLDTHSHLIRLRLYDTELGASLGGDMGLDDLFELRGFVDEKSRVQYIGVELAQIMREMFLKWADAYMKKSEGVEVVEHNPRT